MFVIYVTTLIPWHEVWRLLIERPSYYLENITQLLSHPQIEPISHIKPWLIGEHRQGDDVFTQQAP